MPLGPTNPAWKKLEEVLCALARECGGAFAFVVDEGNGLWCVGPAGDSSDIPAAQDSANRFYRDVVVPQMKGLRRGSHLDMAQLDGDDRYVAISFAGIYVLVVWFKGAFEAPLVRARMRRALPGIEALVLSLPPLGGPGAGEGTGKQRA